MTNKRLFTGGQASRAEVYGLFLAAVVLIGGGVGGAIAFTNADDPTPAVTTSTAPSPSASATTNGDATGAVSSAAPSPVGSASPSASASASTSGTATVSACPYSDAELAYWNSIRAGKQQVVDQANDRVANVNSWITSNTAHLNELLAAPYRPIEVFQRNPDGTPFVWRVDSNDEIAFERQRILDNQSELVRAQAALQAALADRNLVPGC